jgi:hypothetical protein
MSKPAHKEPPILLGLTLGGYFLGLVLLDTLGFILAPIPIAMCVLRGQMQRIPLYIMVAGLAGVMSLALGRVTLVIPMMLFAALGIPIARALIRQTPYMPLVMAITASMLVIQFADMSLQWTALGEQRERLLGMLNARLTGDISEALEVQLNTQVWVLEHWNEVFIGLTISAALLGACIILGWMYRAMQRNGTEPNGSFAQFRPNENVVWVAIVAAGIGYYNYLEPNALLQSISYNAAPGLIILYSLSGLAIVLHAMRLWRPHPILMFVVLLTLFWTGGMVTLTFLGLFDTWGDFRKRMNERVQMANDSHDEFD